MKVRAPYQLPQDKKSDLDYLIKLEWVNLGFRLSIIVVLYFVLGSSQAMKAAWLEDILALLPPIAFLIAMRFRGRPPSRTFPYGYERVTVIAFLCAAVALALLGGYLIVDSVYKLIQGSHPSIGAIELFGETFWVGWLMVAGLAYSVIPPVIIGRLQQPAAEKVHEKTVLADAKMSKADWMTGLAGIVGVLGVGLGFWWADSAAGALIGLDVAKDGVKNTKEAVGDLLDRRPRTVRNQTEGLTERLEERLRAVDWISDAAVRLREEGHVFCGEAFVVPTSDDNLTSRLDDVTDMLEDYDWRIHEVVVTAVPKLKGTPLQAEE